MTTVEALPADLQRLAVAAHLNGRDAEGAEFLARAHSAFLQEHDTRGAARCAIWLAFGLMNNGEIAQASGWLARAHRMLDGDSDCVELGYLCVPEGVRAVHAGDNSTALAAFVEAGAVGERFADTDLMALAWMGQGRVLIRLGETSLGIPLLDEAMVAVTAGEVSPLVAGGIYCSVIEACGEVFDLRRAQEWTSALERWCASQPERVPFRGHCLVRRAEILQLHGEWPKAMEQAREACEKLSHPKPKQSVGAAYYRLGELHRLRGEFTEAEHAFRQAKQWERTPQPGFAQLRLAQGQLGAALTAIRQVVEETWEPSSRLRALEPYVEILLAMDDVPAARAAAEQLAQMARWFRSTVADAMSAGAMAAVLLAEHDSRGALDALRQALFLWRDVEAPYEIARVRVLIARAQRQQGDDDIADLELDAARAIFEKLGAEPDVAHVQLLLCRPKPKAQGPLSPRELEVLLLVASGKTNRAIASRLFISEKTVARHLNNIFTKLDLPSRAAATAYAYQHDLIVC